MIAQPSSNTAKITIYTNQPKEISPDLFGIFFEDLNYAADGGLYAELIQNRSFEYSSADHSDWNFLTGWEILQSSCKCSISLETEAPIHPNNPHYLVLNAQAANGGIGLRNRGFDGIPLKSGENYNVSLFARALTGSIGPLIVRLESRTGMVLGEATLAEPVSEWMKYTATIQCKASDRYACFVLLFFGSGSLAVDMISLFPKKTFRNRSNGLREELAQVIADLKPKFMRFPGGCLVHGDGLDNMYRWKDTIGPIETRKEQPNIWNYHQSVGLGYYEYFQFCEDINAKPIPVVPAGVCCQNTGAKWTGRWGEGQRGLPMVEMPDYIQEVIDLVEWANGPTTSLWGAKRAEAGHPEPFGLEYIGVGNEDHIAPVFKERFKMIYEAVKLKHPEITVIGTVGPFPDDTDYTEGWLFANELKVEMVDEHSYKETEWYWNHLNRFDTYDRASLKVYLGEYAAHDIEGRNTLRSALAEAAYMTSLERNGDVVRLASYAPLLAKQQHIHWVPDLIYFDNTTISLSINYFVQQLFSLNAGDVYIPISVNLEDNRNVIAVSCVQDSKSDDLVVKIVSRAELPVQAQIHLNSDLALELWASCTVLNGDPLEKIAFGKQADVLPKTSVIMVKEYFHYEIPAHSLSVIRIKSRKS